MRSPLVILTSPSLDSLVAAVEGNTAQVVRFGSERRDLRCREGDAECNFPLDDGGLDMGSESFDGAAGGLGGGQIREDLGAVFALGGVGIGRNYSRR